ncbi:RNA-binding domain-containing protein, partial [Tricholoma matsutake]
RGVRRVNSSTHQYLSIYGKIHEVKIVHDYAFVQFESEKDARDVLETFQRQPFLGRNIVVEFARPLRKDMPSVTSGTTDSRSRIRSRHLPSHVQSRYPVIVTNIPRNIRWQELKDFGRTFGGLVAYCDLDRKKHGRGFIEYFSKDDAERAIQELNGKRLGGKRVTVSGITVVRLI